MSDDPRRPGQDDEKPADPPTGDVDAPTGEIATPTGEGEVVGADWLISQLDRDETGEIEIQRRAATQPDSAGDPTDDRPAKAADSPVLAWWREKLVAADALINPEARGDQPQAQDDADAVRPQTQATGPIAPADEARSRVAPDTDDDDEVTLPEPGWIVRPAAPAAEQPAAPVVPPVARPDEDRTRNDRVSDSSDDVASVDDSDWSLGAEAASAVAPADGPEDEPETGLIVTADPPIFKPRSAREHVVEDLESPTPVPLADATVTNDSDDDDDAPFNWALTPNEELDPLVHRTTGGDHPPAPASSAEAPATFVTSSDTASEPTAVLPTVAAAASATVPDPNDTAVPGTGSGSGSGTVSSDDHAPAESALSRRRARRRAEQQTDAQPIVIASAAESTTPAPATPAAPKRDGSGGTRPPRALVLGAIALVAVLVLGGLFFLGSRLPSLLAAPAPTPSATASETPAQTATPTPTPTEAAPAGPAAAGEQKWTALTGGECLDPYTTPWAETFTVVDCAAAHPAQMVFSAPVDADPAAAYPGEDAILSQIYLWCSAPGVLDAAAAGQYSDLQVQGAYPVSEEQWADGERNYFCFVSRSSGEPLTGSLAAPQG
ncbi:MAG: hypothetical protein ABWX65_05670 [Mycetocola sp.]